MIHCCHWQSGLLFQLFGFSGVEWVTEGQNLTLEMFRKPWFPIQSCVCGHRYERQRRLVSQDASEMELNGIQRNAMWWVHNQSECHGWMGRLSSLARALYDPATSLHECYSLLIFQVYFSQEMATTVLVNHCFTCLHNFKTDKRYLHSAHTFFWTTSSCCHINWTIINYHKIMST